MYPDRSPVFNALHRLVDAGSYHAMATRGDDVIGLLGTVHQDLYFRGQPLPMVYFMDFKVDPDFRKGLTAYRMVRQATERELASGTRLGLATLLKNNEAPMAFTKGRGGFPASLYLGDNRIFNCIPVRRLRTDERFTIETPGESDIPELVSLYNRYYATYRLAPRLTEATFRHYTSQIDGLQLGNFRVARREGRIQAVVAMWDELAFRRYFVTRFNVRIRLANGLIRFLSHFTEVPEQIRSHKPLRQLSLVLYAHDLSVDALAALFRHANNLHVGGEYSLLQIQVHQDDPVNLALKGMTGVSLYSEIHLFTDTIQLAREIQNEPGLIHLEFENYL